MRISKVAEMLDRNPITIRRWIDKGYIKAIKIGKIWDITEEEVERIRNGECGNEVKTD